MLIKRPRLNPIAKARRSLANAVLHQELASGRCVVQQKATSGLILLAKLVLSSGTNSSLG